MIGPDGTPVAFPVAAVRETLGLGGAITFEGLTVRLEDGIRVYDDSGREVTSHPAFWFAWSQFHPVALVWADITP